MDDFLSDPGIPGVRSMGPSLCHKLYVFAFCRKTAQIAQSGLFGPKNAVFWPEVILCGQLKINCYNHDGTPKRLPFGVDCIARRSLGGRPCPVGAQNWPENPI